MHQDGNVGFYYDQAVLRGLDSSSPLKYENLFSKLNHFNSIFADTKHHFLIVYST